MMSVTVLSFNETFPKVVFLLQIV